MAVDYKSNYRRWRVYDGIPHQAKQRAGDRGITAEDTEVTTYRFRRRYD